MYVEIGFYLPVLRFLQRPLKQHLDALLSLDTIYHLGNTCLNYKRLMGLKKFCSFSRRSSKAGFLLSFMFQYKTFFKISSIRQLLFSVLPFLIRQLFCLQFEYFHNAYIACNEILHKKYTLSVGIKQNRNCLMLSFTYSKLDLSLENILSEIHVTVPWGTVCRDSGYNSVWLSQEDDKCL